MGISKGTKLTDNPKNKTFKLRLDEKTVEKLDILSNYNLYKREFFDDRIELYFVDSKAFYDSLFGK